jgi:hypothetical protein
MKGMKEIALRQVIYRERIPLRSKDFPSTSLR